MTHSPINYLRTPAVKMAALDHWPAAVHVFDKTTQAALQAAEATGRPLLIRGLPGVGKSQTARAAAWVSGRPLISQVIDGRTEAQDLMFRFDAVRRLADAQVLRPDQQLKDEAHYLQPQALWWAFDWKTAKEAASQPAPPAHTPKGWNPASDRCVLLIDEIDKADPDLPNALLEVLSTQGFFVPILNRRVTAPAGRRPLIIITTNDERELPAPFLRRCLVLKLALPRDAIALTAELADLGQLHQDWQREVHRSSAGAAGWAGSCELIDEVAALVANARVKALSQRRYLPGTSEFLDLVQALAEIAPDDQHAQRTQLATLAEFALSKQLDGPGG